MPIWAPITPKRWSRSPSRNQLLAPHTPPYEQVASQTQAAGGHQRERIKLWCIGRARRNARRRNERERWAVKTRQSADRRVAIHRVVIPQRFSLPRVVIQRR